MKILLILLLEKCALPLRSEKRKPQIVCGEEKCLLSPTLMHLFKDTTISKYPRNQWGGMHGSEKRKMAVNRIRTT